MSGQFILGQYVRMTDDQREAYEERAGILEFCAGMTREEAERVAMQMVLGGANDNQNKQRSCRDCSS
jgi:hypothetical protein